MITKLYMDYLYYVPISFTPTPQKTLFFLFCYFGLCAFYFYFNIYKLIDNFTTSKYPIKMTYKLHFL